MEESWTLWGYISRIYTAYTVLGRFWVPEIFGDIKIVLTPSIVLSSEVFFMMLPVDFCQWYVQGMFPILKRVGHMKDS